MKAKGNRLLTVNQFCLEYDWPTNAGLRQIIFDARHGKNKFQNSFKRVGRRILVDEEAFWNSVEMLPLV